KTKSMTPGPSFRSGGLRRAARGGSARRLREVTVRLLLERRCSSGCWASPSGSETISARSRIPEMSCCSAASSWEIAVKIQIGRLHVPDDPQRYLPERMRAIRAEPLPVPHAHALGVKELPVLHRDPFD